MLLVISAAAVVSAAGADGFFQSLTTQGLLSNPSMRSYGISITDVDGDNRFEAFVTGYGFPNLVYKWEGAGTLHSGDGGGLRDVAARLGVQASSRSAIGVASCDMDGDGVEEIYVLNTDAYSGTKRFGDHIFMRRGPNATRYEDIFARPVNAGVRNAFAGRSVACVDRTGAGTYGVAAASYGAQLHLYELSPPTVHNDRVVDRGGPRGGVGFAGITGGRGITAGPIGKRYQDAPGMDIFMDNERGCNFFFRSRGDGTYEEVAAQLGLQDCAQHGRGVTLMDADGSGGGSIDIVYGAWAGRHRMFTSAAAGGRFTERADELAPGMSQPSLIRTVIAADFDNDGHQEIFFNNIPSYGYAQPNRLFKTDDGKTWKQVDIGEALEPMGYGTGAAAADFDGDGLLELLVAHGESATQPLSLYGPADHAAASANSYLRVLPLTSHGAPARGALVELAMAAAQGAATRRTQVRVIDAGSGYLCQQEPVAHFGLGRARSAVDVTVTWPDGFAKTVKDVAVDQLLVVDRSLPHEAAPDRHGATDPEPNTTTVARPTIGHGAATHGTGTKAHDELVAAHEDVGTHHFNGAAPATPPAGSPVLATVLLAVCGCAVVVLGGMLVVRRARVLRSAVAANEEQGSAEAADRTAAGHISGGELCVTTADHASVV